MYIKYLENILGDICLSTVYSTIVNQVGLSFTAHNYET